MRRGDGCHVVLDINGAEVLQENLGVTVGVVRQGMGTKSGGAAYMLGAETIGVIGPPEGNVDCVGN